MGCSQSTPVKNDAQEPVKKTQAEPLQASAKAEVKGAGSQASAAPAAATGNACQATGPQEAIVAESVGTANSGEALKAQEQHSSSRKTAANGAAAPQVGGKRPAAQQRRGGKGFFALQAAIPTDHNYVPHVNTRAAGVKHIGFGPLKKENQDEFYIQVGGMGGLPSTNLFCVFDGHGINGKDAAAGSRQYLPAILDRELRTYFSRIQNPEEGLKGALEIIISEVFLETERAIDAAGVNLASSGTTAAVAYQQGNQLWVAAVGDSRVILCSKTAQGAFRCQPLTLDHRPRRPSEMERVVAAGARVQPKRLPSGRTVGEPRMWLQQAHSPGLLLSRSLGDLMASTVGCTATPEVSFATLRPHVDIFMVLASDGVWDVLSNDQVSDLVTSATDPHVACRNVLEAALSEWEERMSADNITVVVVQFDWSNLPVPTGGASGPPPSSIYNLSRLPTHVEEPGAGMPSAIGAAPSETGSAPESIAALSNSTSQSAVQIVQLDEASVGDKKVDKNKLLRKGAARQRLAGRPGSSEGAPGPSSSEGSSAAPGPAP